MNAAIIVILGDDRLACCVLALDLHDSGMRFLHQMRHELLHAVPIDPVWGQFAQFRQNV
jgi:hypothetical protein